MTDTDLPAQTSSALPDTLRNRNRLATSLRRVDDILVGDFLPNRSHRRYASLFFMTLAVILGAATYKIDRRLFSDPEISLMPDLLSMSLALALVGSLYLRRIMPWPTSVFLLLSAILNVLITAIVVKAVLGEAAPWFGELSMHFALGTALAMTWLGMRPLAPLAWGLVLVLGFANVAAVSDVMGIFGGLFILSAALGIFLQFDVDPHAFGREIRYDFLGPQEAIPNTERRHQSLWS